MVRIKRGNVARKRRKKVKKSDRQTWLFLLDPPSFPKKTNQGWFSMVSGHSLSAMKKIQ